ncbi:MAG: histidine triad nucleotide-binding protein [Elusimicrobiota bacterium]
MSTPNDCIFCKIAAGQIPANIVYQDEQVIAFRDLTPVAPVHILTIPKKHIDRLSAVEEHDFSLIAHLHKVIQKIAEKEGISKTGFRLTTNNGGDAGQSVQHLHFHLLGGRKLSWPPG